MNKTIYSIAAALLVCAACVDGGSDDGRTDETPVQPDKAEDAPEVVSDQDIHALDTSNAETCDIVADADEPEGPCSAACDNEALQAFVPEGTCMTFLCPTADGGSAKVGACNN